MSLRFGTPASNGPALLPETLDDRHVLVKDQSITPHENELDALLQLVTLCERALKLASDEYLTQVQLPEDQVNTNIPAAATSEPVAAVASSDIEMASGSGSEDIKSGGTATATAATTTPKPAPVAAPAQPTRVLRGVMRVGALANGLVIRSDLNVQLILLTSRKPNRQMLEFIFKQLSSKVKVPHRAIQLHVEFVSYSNSMFERTP